MDPMINYPRPHRWTREEYFDMVDLG